MRSCLVASWAAVNDQVARLIGGATGDAIFDCAFRIRVRGSARLKGKAAVAAIFVKVSATARGECGPLFVRRCAVLVANVAGRPKTDAAELVAAVAMCVARLVAGLVGPGHGGGANHRTFSVVDMGEAASHGLEASLVGVDEGQIAAAF